jgi:hypothetical protein
MSKNRVDYPSSPEFVEGQVDTGFIEKHHDTLLPPVVVDFKDVALCAVGVLLGQESAGVVGQGLDGRSKR